MGLLGLFEHVSHWISFDHIRDMVQSAGPVWGGLVVFALLFSCGLGVPIPEDIPLIIAGAFLVTRPHHWFIVGTLCWCGIIGGDIVLYSLGRRYGMNVKRIPLIGKHIKTERIAHVEKLFEKYGTGVVGVGRLFAGIRGVMVFTAGTIRFNFAKFIVADGLAAIVSGGFFMIVGHWIGSKLNDDVIRKFKHYFASGGGVLAIILVAWMLWRRKKHPPGGGAAEPAPVNETNPSV